MDDVDTPDPRDKGGDGGGVRLPRPGDGRGGAAGGRHSGNGGAADAGRAHVHGGGRGRNAHRARDGLRGAFPLRAGPGGAQRGEADGPGPLDDVRGRGGSSRPRGGGSLRSTDPTGTSEAAAGGGSPPRRTDGRSSSNRTTNGRRCRSCCRRRGSRTRRGRPSRAAALRSRAGCSPPPTDCSECCAGNAGLSGPAGTRRGWNTGGGRRGASVFRGSTRSGGSRRGSVRGR